MRSTKNLRKRDTPLPDTYKTTNVFTGSSAKLTIDGKEIVGFSGLSLEGDINSNMSPYYMNPASALTPQAVELAALFMKTGNRDWRVQHSWNDLTDTEINLLVASGYNPMGTTAQMIIREKNKYHSKPRTPGGGVMKIK